MNLRRKRTRRFDTEKRLKQDHYLRLYVAKNSHDVKSYEEVMVSELPEKVKARLVK
ncbi:YxeA family protein [Fictibacillus macauensis]|uniref:YxeA family protein n=1 Tax=Fictibacillus macauensis TaxID=245160 RepID=UPI000307E46F|nr:YxeA family protein [Fictibacillus macauensis]